MANSCQHSQKPNCKAKPSTAAWELLSLSWFPRHFTRGRMRSCTAGPVFTSIGCNHLFALLLITIPQLLQLDLGISWHKMLVQLPCEKKTLQLRSLAVLALQAGINHGPNSNLVTDFEFGHLGTNLRRSRWSPPPESSPGWSPSELPHFCRVSCSTTPSTETVSANCQ